MNVKRLDLGAEVVHIPSRDLLVIHPDLDYAEAVGAVHGTIPGLHLDTVMQLVEQVTPRPKKPPRRWPAIGVRMALASLATLLLVFHFGTNEPAVAGAKFGDVWAGQMNQMGLDCYGTGDTRTCTSKDGGVTEISGYDRKDASLYILRSSAGRSYLLVFDFREAARKWHRKHPEVAMTGRAAVW